MNRLRGVMTAALDKKTYLWFFLLKIELSGKQMQ
jgi:hypothetical protein